MVLTGDGSFEHSFAWNRRERLWRPTRLDLWETKSWHVQLGYGPKPAPQPAPIPLQLCQQHVKLSQSMRGSHAENVPGCVKWIYNKVSPVIAVVCGHPDTGI